MAKVVGSSSSDSPRRTKPATDPYYREQQLIAKAVDLAEKQLDDGTASSQVITHFLKLGTVRAELELEKMRLENQLTQAKTKALESDEDRKKLYEDAIKAMRNYSGNGDPDDY